MFLFAFGGSLTGTYSTGKDEEMFVQENSWGTKAAGLPHAHLVSSAGPAHFPIIA